MEGGVHGECAHQVLQAWVSDKKGRGGFGGLAGGSGFRNRELEF